METVGRKFLCISDVIFGNDIVVFYKKGKIYKSEIQGCITNEEGNKEHLWIEDDYDIYWKSFFKIIGNKRKDKRKDGITEKCVVCGLSRRQSRSSDSLGKCSRL